MTKETVECTFGALFVVSKQLDRLRFVSHRRLTILSVVAAWTARLLWCWRVATCVCVRFVLRSWTKFLFGSTQIHHTVGTCIVYTCIRAYIYYYVHIIYAYIYMTALELRCANVKKTSIFLLFSIYSLGLSKN